MDEKSLPVQGEPELIRGVSDVFQPALDELRLSGKRVWGPRQFKAYLVEHGLSASGRKTPEFISIDSREGLHRRLKEAGVMVLRLGRANAPGTGTAFALVQLGADLGDLFLSDEALIAGATPETFLPTAPVRDLFPFHLMPQLSEPNVLSYAFASGMLAEALSLDVRGPMPPAATGASTLSFSFRAHPSTEEVFRHDQGQVEIDAMFVSQRGGRPCLFILEAKVGSSRATLAKHKLAYPVLGLARSVPPDMEVIPVYARFSTSSAGLQALIAECRFDGVRNRDSPAVLSDVTPHQVRLLAIPKDVAVGF